MLEQYPEVFCAYRQMVINRLRGIEETKKQDFFTRREATRRKRIEGLRR